MGKRLGKSDSDKDYGGKEEDGRPRVRAGAILNRGFKKVLMQVTFLQRHEGWKEGEPNNCHKATFFYSR